MWECKHCGYLREDKPKETWDTCPNCDNFNWMRQGERNDIKWVQAAPVQEGWYWAKEIGDDEVKPVRVTKSPDGLWVESWDAEPYDGSRLCFVSQFTHWLGPLPVPAPPAESE